MCIGEGKYAHNRVLSHKKEQNWATCRDVAGPTVCWVKSDREGEISYHTPYMWILKRNDINELTYKVERNSQT